MFYKVLKGTKLHGQLTELIKDCKSCNNASLELAKEFGTDKIRGGLMRLAGGISSFVLEGGKPVGWKASGSKMPNEYFPSRIKANKELLDRIEKLPTVTYKQLNDLVGYDDMWGHPGFVTKNNMILLEFTERQMQYLKKKNDMIEITRSEYYNSKDK